MSIKRPAIPGFYKLGVNERAQALHEHGLLSASELRALTSGQYTLDPLAADTMIENVIGVMGLPLGLGMNLMVNGREYVVPMVVEEPSIVAAVSAACKLVRACGGFVARAADPILIGQIQVLDITDIEAAKRQLHEHTADILDLANGFQPNMVARGGGAKGIEMHVHPRPSRGTSMLVVHLLVDTRDAMGANLVNDMCEGVAPLIESLTGGRVLLRILSNLADRALVTAECRIPVPRLAGRGRSGEAVRDALIAAADFAAVDPYRAATHNKGIMNGIDPVAIATGNDWRAIEAGAHAYAARGGRYTSLTTWTAADDDQLCGRIEIPLKVGTVGGSLQSNPAVALNLRLLGVESAPELACVMAAMGLAQNFAAIRALATEGIQKGHMALHARSVVTSAGAPPEIFDEVLKRVLESGVIKVWKAREIATELAQERSEGVYEPSEGVASVKSDETAIDSGQSAVQSAGSIISPTSKTSPVDSGTGSNLETSPVGAGTTPTARMGAAGSTELSIAVTDLGGVIDSSAMGIGYGKVVLLGEHAVVYGRHAVAVPIPMTIRATIEDAGADGGVVLSIPGWGMERKLAREPDARKTFEQSAGVLLDALGLGGRDMRIEVTSDVPRGMGLGGSAAMAVAIVRALDQHFRLGLGDDEVNRLAFESEKIAHGSPSGLDNTLACYGRPLLFKRGEPPLVEPLEFVAPIPAVVGLTGKVGLTATTVGRVREAWQRDPVLYEGLFDQIDALTLHSVQAIRDNALEGLGELMNVCHGLLNALQVSSLELEQLVAVARKAGALGAKLTGGGGGGSIIAIGATDEEADRIAKAIQDAGFQTVRVRLGAQYHGR